MGTRLLFSLRGFIAAAWNLRCSAADLDARRLIFLVVSNPFVYGFQHAKADTRELILGYVVTVLL